MADYSSAFVEEIKKFIKSGFVVYENEEPVYPFIKKGNTIEVVKHTETADLQQIIDNRQKIMESEDFDREDSMAVTNYNMINGAYKLLKNIGKCQNITKILTNRIYNDLLNGRVNHKGNTVSWPLELIDDVIVIYEDTLQQQFDIRSAILKDMDNNQYIKSNYKLFKNFTELMEKNKWTNETIKNTLDTYNNIEQYLNYFGDEMYNNVLNPLNNEDELALYDYAETFKNNIKKCIDENLIIKQEGKVICPLVKNGNEINITSDKEAVKLYDDDDQQTMIKKYLKRMRNAITSRQKKLDSLANQYLQISNNTLLEESYNLLNKEVTGDDSNNFSEALDDITLNPLDQIDFLLEFTTRMCEILKEDGNKEENKRTIKFDNLNRSISPLVPTYDSDNNITAIALSDSKLQDIFDTRAIKIKEMGNNDYLVISNFTMLKNALDILKNMKDYSTATIDIINQLSTIIATSGKHPNILISEDGKTVQINQNIGELKPDSAEAQLQKAYNHRDEVINTYMFEGKDYLINSDIILSQIYKVLTELHKNLLIQKIISLTDTQGIINSEETIKKEENGVLKIINEELKTIYAECQKDISNSYASKILWEIYNKLEASNWECKKFQTNIKLLYAEQMIRRIADFVYDQYEKNNKIDIYPVAKNGEVLEIHDKTGDNNLKIIFEQCKTNVGKEYANNLLWQIYDLFVSVNWIPEQIIYSPKNLFYKKIILDEITRLVILDYNDGNRRIDDYPIYKDGNIIYITDKPQFNLLKQYRDQCLEQIGNDATYSVLCEIYDILTESKWQPKIINKMSSGYYMSQLKLKIIEAIKAGNGAAPISIKDGNLTISDQDLANTYANCKQETSDSYASNTLWSLYNQFVAIKWDINKIGKSSDEILNNVLALANQEEQKDFTDLIMSSDIIHKALIFNNIDNCAENYFNEEMQSNKFSNPLMNQTELQGNDLTKLFVEKMCEIIEGNLLQYDENNRLISPLIQTEEGAITAATTTTGQTIGNILQARQTDINNTDEETEILSNAEMLILTYNVLKVMREKGYGIDYFKDYMYNYVLGYEGVSEQDFSQQFIEKICTFIQSDAIEYEKINNKYIPIFPLVKDENKEVRIVNSKGGEVLANILEGRQKKIVAMGDDANFVISNKNMLIKAYNILEQMAILYNEEKKYAQCIKAFRTLMFEAVLDSDYAQGIIDIIADDFYQASNYNFEGTRLDNKYFTENLDDSITINSAAINVALSGRKEKISRLNIAVVSNELLIQLIVQAIHESSRDVDTFKTKIKEKLNPDYSLTIMEYLYNNYQTAKDKKYIIKTMVGRNEVFKFNDYENNETYSEQNKEAIKYLMELFELREAKRQADESLKTQTLDNATIMQAVIGKNFYAYENRETFKEKAREALVIDYSMWMIELLYSHYTLNNKIRFDEWGHVIFPIAEGEDKNFYFVDIENENEENKEFATNFQDYYNLRTEKINRLNIDFISNQLLLNYIGISLNATYSNIEFYNNILDKLKKYYEGEINDGLEGPIEYDNSAKLYPPSIESALPAFCEGEKIRIPFTMNKTVSWNQIKGFSIRIKNIQTNAVIQSSDAFENDYSQDLYEAYFDYDAERFAIGNFYKVQIAYISHGGTYGFYSTVGIIKYTKKPHVEIEGLKASQLHTDIRTYLGKYSQKDRDISEKIYSYNFTIYDESQEVVETSGELLHNHENDKEIYESNDMYTLKISLEENKIYTIVYTVTTANGLVISSPKYRIVQQSTIPPEVEASLIATMNEENGYVDIQLIGNKDKNGIEKVGTGTFLICRASSEDNYTSWSEIDRFALFGEKPSEHSWQDFTVQHGFNYIYSLQQYNKEYQIYSNRMLSNEIAANFEHSFLYDGKRQLKIKFNPKVTSFKETLLEQKTNTLGGKFPFFFRNANVSYKEFPISGLISYHSDEEGLFLTNEDLFLEDLSSLSREHTLNPEISSQDREYFENMLDINHSYYLKREYEKREQISSQEKLIAKKRDRTVNQVDYNIVAERIFKMKVLEFLNDGKPKLFRSPGEGNYIVRLMNSSLSPNDTLGRMIHTFSTTATEIDEFSYQTLNKYSLIQIDEPDTKQLRWKTIDIRNLINDAIDQGKLSDWISIGGENNIQSIQFIDMQPGDLFKIEFPAGGQDDLQVQIGMTGAYYMQFNQAVSKILISSKITQGQVTYSYYGSSLHHFDTYRYIKTDDIPIIQLSGSTQNIDIRKYFKLEDIKHRITKYYFLNFIKDYEWSKELNNKLQILKEKYLNHKDYYINEQNEMIDIRTFEKYEAEIERIEKTYNENKYKFWIDGKEFDISETDNYQLSNLDHLPQIILGPGILLDASIQRREIEYDVEENNREVKEAKDIYLKDQEKVSDLIYGSTNINRYEIELKAAKKEKDNSYKKFIELLEIALKQKEVDIN